MTSPVRSVVGALLLLTPALVLAEAPVVSKLAEAVITKGQHAELSVPLTDLDLQGLDSGQLRILRNTLFAKYGRRFRSTDLQQQFGRFAWYKAEHDNVDDELTPVELNNVKLIRLHENPAALFESKMPGIFTDCWAQSGQSGSKQGFQMLQLKAGGKIEGQWFFASDTVEVKHAGSWSRKGKTVTLKWMETVVEDVPDIPKNTSRNRRSLVAQVVRYEAEALGAGYPPGSVRGLVDFKEGENVWRCSLCFRGDACNQ